VTALNEVAMPTERAGGVVTLLRPPRAETYWLY